MMYQCFHCRQFAVVWENDASFEDLGFDGEGVINICRCTNCGAEIIYKIASDNETGVDYG